MWLITFKTNVATFQRVAPGTYPTGETLQLDDAVGEAFESFDQALKMFNDSLKLGYDMEEGRTEPRKPDHVVLGIPGQQVWVVERAPMWCEVSREFVGENGKVPVSRFGTYTELDLDAHSPTDMGYDGAIGWAISDQTKAYELKRHEDAARRG